MKQQEQIYKNVPISNNIKNYPKTSKNSKALIKAKIIKSGNKSMDVTSKKNRNFYSNFYKIKFDISSPEQNNNKTNIDNTKEKYYWFAAYDKMIKSNKIFKIFSFYNLASKNSIALGNKNLYDEFKKIKEKKIIIKNYEIFFIKGLNSKPFIRQNKGKQIHVKLYLLSLKQINMIFSYINRIEYDNYLTSFDGITEKNKYINIYKGMNNNINYPTLFYLGSFMNTKIISFSRLLNENNKLNSINDIEIDLIPNPKKIAKLIKLLLINFPEYSKEYFIDYIFSYFTSIPNLSEITNNIITDKKNEINNLLLSQRKSLYKIRNENKNSRKQIGTNFQNFPFSPFLSSFSNNNNSGSNNTNSDLIKNNNSNSNINLINNINNNIGTISYNPSYFDFTSDYLFSIQQNKENLSKILDSFKSLSYRNKNTNTNNITDKIILSLSDNNRNTLKHYINNNVKNQMKQQNSIMDKNTNSRISNFSFENDSKVDKINVNKKRNTIRDVKKLRNFFIKKDLIKNIENYTIPKVPSLCSKKTISINSGNKKNFTSYIKKPKYSLDSIPHKKIHNFTIIKSENKENSNYFSNCGNKRVKNVIKKDKIVINKNNCLNINPNKTFLKGEDIFQKTENNSKQKINPALMYILDKNGVKSFDLKNIRKSKKLLLSNK